jgi:uncharacterized protein (DUF302 family)
MEPRIDSGLVTRNTRHSVDEIVSAITAILAAKGITLFALVDHSGEAAAVGLTMPPTKLLIFGDPKAGTPLMLASPTSAIDLPLKILVWQDPQGEVKVSYNSPAYLGARHQLPEDLLAPVSGVEALVAKVIQ